MKNVFGVLTPLAVDPAHPFPHIANLEFEHRLDRGNGRGSQMSQSRLAVLHDSSE